MGTLEPAPIIWSDDATVVGIQYATVVNRAFFRPVKAIYLLIANDVLNGSRRHYFTAAGRPTLVGPAGRRWDSARPPVRWSTSGSSRSTMPRKVIIKDTY